MRTQTLMLIPLLALGACSEKTPDPRGVEHDETLLSVSATGRSETKPDEARFTAGVSTIAASAEDATRRNNETMTKVTEALKAFGVADKDLQTRQLTVNRIDWGANKGKYEAVNQVEVRMRAVDKAGEAVAATTQAGANVLSGPTLRVSDREAATKSAYAAAYRAARARAEAYAGAAGLKIDRVLTIRDGGDSAPPPMPITKWMRRTGLHRKPPRRPSTRASANRRFRCVSISPCRRNSSAGVKQARKPLPHRLAPTISSGHGRHSRHSG